MLKSMTPNAMLIQGLLLPRALALEYLLWDLIHFSIYEENFKTDFVETDKLILRKFKGPRILKTILEKKTVRRLLLVNF